ncbi:MAG: hypothetical protein ACO28P_01420 [Ilumatobacteraceae bacterium]
MAIQSSGKTAVGGQNFFITQQVGPVCNQALGILHWASIMPRLLYRDLGVSGSLAVGSVVNVRKPATLTAAKFDRAAGIATQTITESTIPVALTDIFDVSVALTDEQVTLDLDSFGSQVTMPAMLAISTAMEQECIKVLESGSHRTTGAAPAGKTAQVQIASTNPVQSVIDVAAALNQNEAPLAGRVMVVGTALAALIKKDQNLLRVNESGNGDVLRSATIGRVAGFDIIENPHIGPKLGYAFTNDAAVWVSRALSTIGAVNTSSGTYESVAIRTVIDHDIQKKQVVASFDTLVGGAILDEKRLVPVYMA